MPNETFVIDSRQRFMRAWDLVFLPNADTLTTERPGWIRIFHNDRLQPAPVLTISSIEVNGKMGLLGICLHHAFAVMGEDVTEISIDRPSFVSRLDA